MKGTGIRFPAVAFAIIAFFFVLDRLIYDYLIFQPTNMSGWDSFRWYNFEYHFRQIEKRRKNWKKPWVLIVGSSVAKYATDTTLLSRELRRRTGRDIGVELLSHASLMPTDLKYYWKRIKQIHPSLIVYIINPADLDLERYAAPWSAEVSYSDAAEESYLRIRLPTKLYYPGKFAWDRRTILDWKSQFSLYLREAITGLRYRHLWFDPLRHSYRFGRGRLRKYLNYQGAELPIHLWRDGHTGVCAAFPTSYMESNARLLMEIPAPLVKTGNLQIHFYTMASDAFPGPRSGLGHTHCIAPASARLLCVVRPTRSGWQTLAPGACKNVNSLPNQILFLRLNHAIGEFGAVRRVRQSDPPHLGRGLRLIGNFGRSEIPQEDYLRRLPELRDQRLLSMSRRKFLKDFERRVHPEKWREAKHIALHQFNRLRNAKYYLNWIKFSEIYQVREFNELIANTKDGMNLLIINNPENPITLSEYDSGPWYSGYLSHFRRRADENPSVTFVDYKDTLRMQYFSDAHHLSHPGLLRMLPHYTNRIFAILQQSEVGSKDRD